MNNYECMGYVINALKELKYPDDEIQLIIDKIRREFDFVSEDRAYEIWQNFK
jgi:hypothetical protein